MILKNHVLAACSVFVFIFCFIAGWWVIAGLVPPLSPSATAEEVAAFYQGNQLRIQIGIALAMSSVAYIIPMASALGYQLRRIEDSKPMLANAQLACATATVAIVTVALIIWSVAAYRPDRPIEITYLLNDLAWIGFTMPVSGIVVWMLCVGLCIFSDKASKPIFPRWAGYLSLFCATLTLPGFPVVIFQSGPLAWNGLLSFWIALTAAITWMTAMSFLTIRAAITESNNSASLAT